MQPDGSINGGHFRTQLINDDEEEGSPSKSKDVILTPSRNLANSLLGSAASSEKRSSTETENGVSGNANNDGMSAEIEPLLTTTPQPITPPPFISSKAISACINYSFCSVSMILVNKSLASR
jgi:hypothetical protein